MKPYIRFIVLLISLGTSVMLLGSSISYAAAPLASFSIAPAAATENVGDTFSVGVYENSNGSGPINAITTDINYPSAMLQVESVACAGSFSNSVGAATISSMSCYVTPGVTGPSDNNELIGVINFKVLTTGSAVISFVGTPGSTTSSSLIGNGDGTNLWNGSTTGATYTLATTPAPVVNTPSAPVKTSVTPPPSSSSSTASTTGNGGTSTATSSTTNQASSMTPTKKTNPAKKSTTENLKIKRTATKISSSIYWLTLLVFVAAGVIILAARRKPIMGVVKGQFGKYKLGSTTTKKPSRAKKAHRSTGSKKKTTKK